MKACLKLSEFAGRNFCGQVARTANAIDPATRTLLTEVDVPNPSGTLVKSTTTFAAGSPGGIDDDEQDGE